MNHKSKPTATNGVSVALDANKENSEETEQQIADFLEKFGSYVKLDTCMAYASALESKSVIDALLRIAKYDPRHKEVVKQLAKSTSLLFYEPVSERSLPLFSHGAHSFRFQSMLSAIVHLVSQIHEETNAERKEAIVGLCATAYPDVRPWQVKSACDDSDADLYYTYLSVLLQPIDGNELAQQDARLVKVSRFFVTRRSVSHM